MKDNLRNFERGGLALVLREEGPRAVDRWKSTIKEPAEKAAMRNNGVSVQINASGWR